jgi:hypothetical protein
MIPVPSPQQQREFVHFLIRLAELGYHLGKHVMEEWNRRQAEIAAERSETIRIARAAQAQAAQDARLAMLFSQPAVYDAWRAWQRAKDVPLKPLSVAALERVASSLAPRPTPAPPTEASQPIGADFGVLSRYGFVHEQRCSARSTSGDQCPNAATRPFRYWGNYCVEHQPDGRCHALVQSGRCERYAFGAYCYEHTPRLTNPKRATTAAGRRRNERVVERTAPRAWRVVGLKGSFPTQAEAIVAALGDLRKRGGGYLVIMTTKGSLKSRRYIDGSSPPSRQGGAAQGP